MSTGAYFRAQREGKWTNVLIEDLTTEERANLLKSKEPEFLISCIELLSQTLKDTSTLNAEYLDHIGEAARQECFTKKVAKDYNGQVAGTDVTDSGAISTRAAMLRLLAAAGRFRIVAEGGRMVVGYWPENDPENGQD